MKAFVKTGAALLLGALAIAAGPAFAQQEMREPQPRGTINVIGEATSTAPPDMAILRFAVVTRDPDPETARSANAEAAQAAMDAVRELIENERRMRLETLRLQPVQEYDPEKNRTIEKGFEAVRDIVVEVEDLEKLPSLVARVVQKGANRLHGVTYELKNRESVRNEALIQAVLNARLKASLMAEALDAFPGRVIRISEQGSNPPTPFPQADRMESFSVSRAAAPEPASYSPGEIEIRVKVDVTFELETRG